MQKLGIKETKELLAFGFAIPKALKKALADGKIDLLDSGYAIPVLSLAPEAFDGVTLVDDELLDLDEAEWAEIIQIVKSEVGEVSNEKAVAIAGQVLKFAKEGYALLKLI